MNSLAHIANDSLEDLSSIMTRQPTSYSFLWVVVPLTLKHSLPVDSLPEGFNPVISYIVWTETSRLGRGLAKLACDL